MAMHSWLGKLVRPNRNHPFTRRSPKEQNRARLTIEGLEDRWVPATYTVLNTNDTGPGSLRDAVAQANANIGADTIVFGDGSGSGGTNFLDATPDTIILTSGDITFAGDTSLTTVTGPGANLLTISGGNTQRAFWVNTGIVTSLSGMTLSGGRANGTPGTNASAGAAVYNAGTLDLTNVTVSGNSSTGTGGSGKGGAVHSQGNLTLTNCIVTGNTGNGVNTGNGSGILAVINSTISNNTLSGLQVGGGQARLINTTISGNTRQGVNAYLTNLMMANCTVSGNSSSGDGAGVLIGLGSSALTNCTITGNHANGNGGGILLRGTVTLTNCTISGNSATIGGGLNVFSGTPTLVNTVVAGNTATTRGPDVGGTSNNPQAISSLGNNLIGKTDGSTGWISDDLTGTVAAPLSANLGTLADNGGATKTMALLTGSPAINAGNSSLAPSEVQDIAIYAPTGSGTFTVTFNGQTTGLIAYNAAAGTLQNALNTLSNIGGVGGSVLVTKSGNVFRVTFGGTLAHQDPLQMTAIGQGGVTATVLTVVNGNSDQRDQWRSGNTDIGAFESQFKVYSTSDSGSGSLRQVIANAGASLGPDTIVFSSLFNTAQTITLTNGVLIFNDTATTTLSGPGANLLTITANNSDTVFAVRPGKSAAFLGITITGGINSGLINQGAASLTECVVSGNSVTNGNGGGIYNGIGATNLDLNNCTISGNSANGGKGGGLFSFQGTTTLTNSTVSGNSATLAGGGIGASGMLTLTNCTISGNSMSGTDINDGGGGVWNSNITTLANTIIAGNNPSNGNTNGPDIKTISNPFVSQGHNLIGKINGDGGTTWDSTDLTGTIASPLNPQLAPLANNGGKSQTMALLPNSPAINAGNATNAPVTDQRSLPRFGNTDIGAFEYQFKVTSTADNGTGSLRQAIANANSSTGNDTVLFSSLFNSPQTITLTSGVINLTDTATTTITGTSAGVTVSGNNASGVFKVNNGASAALSRLTITGGNAYQGGGLWNDFGNVTITDSAVTNNTASFAGGLDNVGGTMVLTNVTLSGNTASNNGGAIDNVGATLTLVNTTISGNTAAEGGGIRNNGTANISNTIIAGNTAPSAPDVWNPVHSLGNNLIGKTDGSSGWVDSDLTGTIASPLNPKLGPLASNGGPTQTMALLSGSPAINAGNSANAPTADQRALIRKGNTDIGAYEAQFKVYTTADSGNGSLRQAINEANTSPGADDIVFTSLFNTAQTITLTSGQITFFDTATTTISDTLGGVTVSGNNAGRVFFINAGASASIRAMTITGGLSGSSGGAIANAGNLSLTSATVYGNTSGDDSGAIANFGGATLSITNSTFANNNTANDGGAIRNAGTLNITNSTFSGNHSGIAGGAIRNDGTLAMANSIVAGNSTNQVGPDIYGIVASLGNNLIGKTDTSSGWVGTDLTGTIASPLNAQIGSLANNGGPTQTMALLPSSPAVNAGNASLAPVNDQRGQVRFGNSDIGAFEYLFKVTNTENSGNGSLRSALNNANIVNTLDTILFKIPGSGVKTITPLSALPTIVNPVIIDGTSANGYAGTPLIEIVGVSAGAGVHGFTISSSGSTISGLAINRFSGSGIVVTGGSATGNVIKGNYLGIGTDGVTDLGNTLDGITITAGAANNTIGGVGTNDRNVISGNTGDGIEITGSGSDTNVIIGNYIGLNAAGTSPVRNDGAGVFINTGPQFTRIGTNGDGVNDANERNVISGNSSIAGGANINIVSANQNRVSGNYIGTNATGTATVLNGGRGIRVATGSSFNIIGTDGSNDPFNANERNLVSGSNNAGIFLAGSANDNTIAGNWVGLNAAGTAALGNGAEGISISSSMRNLVGSNANGISDDSEANVVVGGGGFGGILLADPGNQNNIVAGNFIGTNPSGTNLLGSQQYGVSIGNDAHDNRIGGLNASERNIISGSSKHGIYVVRYQTFPTGYNTTIQGNYIGTDVSGTVDLGNANDGVMLENSYGNIVGGTTAGAGNLISGNNLRGVEITGSLSTGNSVLGNRIGTDVNGNSALANSSNGILISGGATGNTVGGSASGSRNIISGNNAAGVLISGTGTNTNVVAGNYIGLNINGNSAIPNRAGGVRIRLGAQFNLIGTNADGVNDTNERNVISGNINFDGVSIGNAGTNFNVVSGNYLGTDPTGTFAIGNSDSGVSIFSGAQFNRVGTNGLKGFVLNATEGNLISGNGLDGVYLENANNNTFAGNIIGLNASGTAVLRNGTTGMIILSGASGNTIGSNSDGIGDADERNVISGNQTYGIQITGATTTSNVIAGNFVGTDISGTLDRGNQLDGIHIDSGAKNNVIGGSAIGSGNLISGNDGSGIYVTDVGTSGNSILTNIIGMNLGGSAAIANSVGIWLANGSNGTVIGGNSTSTRNLVQGNTGDALTIGAGASAKVGGTFTGSVTNSGVLELNGNSLNVVGTFNGNGTVINSSASTAATLSLNGNGTFSGIMQNGGSAPLSLILSGGIFTLSGANLYTGPTTINGGSLVVNGSLVSSVVVASGGSLSGSGSVGGINNQGVVSPGSSPGILTVNGNYSQTGSLTEEIQGVNQVTPEFDQIIVNGTVTLGGTLNSSLMNGFISTLGNSFQIITNDGTDPVIGTFAGLAQGATFHVGTRYFKINYFGGDGNDVVISGIGITVTTTSDSGLGSLRQAILDVNSHPGLDIIAFNIPGLGSQTLSPGSPLPVITDSVLVDGSTQPGFHGTPLIQIDGSNSGNSPYGIKISGDGSTIKNLIISNFQAPNASGIILAGNNNRIQGNWIGLNTTASFAAPNWFGISMGGSGNLVGGNDQSDGNLIRGNLSSGIQSVASSGTVQGNTIAFNGGTGVVISSGNTLVRQNSIIGNTGLGIDVGGTGLTPNDPGDLDHVVNAPVLTAAHLHGGLLQITGYSRPGATIEFFIAGVDSTKFGEGATYLATAVEGSGADTDSTVGTYISPLRGLNVGTDSTNRFSFLLPVSDSVTDDSIITALALDPSGSSNSGTSEFAANISLTPGVVFGAPLVYAGADATILEGGTFSGSGTFSDLDSTKWTATVDYGDGSGVQALPINPVNYQSGGDEYTPSATATFNLAHVYAKAGTFSVNIRVTDDSGNTGTGFSTVVVNSAPTQIDDSNIHVFPSVIQEGGTVTVTGTFTDPSSVDSHSVMITWGDGSVSPADSIDEVNRTFTATHTYSDDKPKGTESDVYSLQVAITDNTSAVAKTTYGLFYVQVNNVRPTSLTLAPLSNTIDENGFATLGGTFIDPGVLDQHLVTINWGDGTPNDVIPLGAGVLGFSGITHQYLNNPSLPATSYQIQVSVTDDDEPFRPATANASIVVKDISASKLQLFASPPISTEGSLTILSGIFTDPGTRDRHKVVVNWGDGSPNSEILLPEGVSFFSGLGHTYQDNPLGQPAGAYAIQVTVTDVNEPAGTPLTGIQSLTVLNVAPTIDTLSLTRTNGLPLSPSSITGAVGQINENDEVLLTGTFNDLGRLDNHVVSIDWGDGSPAVLTQLSKGFNTFKVAHRFVDNAVGTLVSLNSIRVTIADYDGAETTGSINLAIANVPPEIHILSGGGSTSGVTLKANASDAGPIDTAALTYLWTVSGSTLIGTEASFTLPNPTAFQSYQVTLTVTDNDGVSTSTTTSVIALDDNPNIFEIPAQSSGVSSVTVFGLGGDDIISAGSILTDGFNRIIFNADGVPMSSGLLNIPVILDGGTGQDTLIGGSADDTIYLQQGNDLAYGQGGNDLYRLKPNSTLTVVDGSGFNTLDFGLADFGSNVGVTFNLQDTSGQIQDVAPVGSLAGHHFVSANDLGTGSFTTLIGSSFDDKITAASGATLYGGAGSDTFIASSSETTTITNTIFNGGADGDFLITSGPNIGNLTFNGDDGVDVLQNLGVITGSLIFQGGADADAILNSPTGVILGSPTFNGDDGGFTITNQGVIEGTPTFNGGADGDVLLTNFGTIAGTPIFNGGADAEVLINQPGGVITGSPTFNGDDGVIFVTNYGVIDGTPTFQGGADADSFINGPGGVISGSLVFNGDDGANIVTNFGVILGTPTFTGGADADVFTNSQGGVISGSPIFSGGADADSFLNAPGAVVSGNLVFNGDIGADLITNYGTISGTPTFSGGADGDVFTNAPGAVISGAMTFNGDDGANTIVNFGAITGSPTFVGGADADAFTNATGAVISGSPLFTGGADADTFVNSVNASITGTLTFNGDDGADTLINAGTIGDPIGQGGLTFHGGADADAILNPGTVLGTLSFNGDEGADMFYNGATVGGTTVSGSVTTLTFNGDSGADLLTNPLGGSIGTLTFGGGADGDVLSNQGVILGNLTFNGDDGANFLTNSGTVIGTAMFTGGADADTFINIGPIGSLNFNGDLGSDKLYNSQSSIGLIAFDAGPGNDLFINDGNTIGKVSFAGGSGNDVFGNTGSNLGFLSFQGDDGADTFVNTGNTNSGFNTTLIFGGGADQDTLINKGSATGTGFFGVSFTGDDGADTLINQGSNLNTLIFAGGADSDGFLNTGNHVGTIRFSGDDGADILRNDGTNLGILTFAGGADGDVLANFGTVIGALTFNGDEGADFLTNSGTISGTIAFNGDEGSDLLVNHSTGVISGPATFNGGADADSLLNNEGGTITGSLTFNGDEGADLLGNAGIIPGALTFNGGADGDFIVNVGSVPGSLSFSGDDGADAIYNGGYVNGVFVGGTISTLTFNGDDGADVLSNPVGATIGTLNFGGGADGDVLSNLGVVSGSLLYEGDSGADVLVNQVGGVINGPLIFNGGADGDVLYNQPGAVIGALGTGLTFNGDDGSDSLINSGTVAGTLTFGGGADGDTLTNSAGGIIAGTLTFNGDDGADQVNNQLGAILGTLIFNGGADGDFLTNQGTVNGNLSFNGDDGANTLSQGGLVSGSLTFVGGADGDTLTIQAGSVVGGSLTFTGDDGANTLIISGAIAGSLMFSGGSDADVLIFSPTGSSPNLEAHTGAGNDQFIIAGGNGTSFLLDGGVGDDTYTFVGLPNAKITVDETYSGTADSSSDTLDFSGYTGGAIVLDLALTTPQVLFNNRLTLTLEDSNGMENVIGTPQADTVYGNDRPNLLTGAALADDRMIAPSATPPQGLQAISRTQWVLLDFDSYSEKGEHVYTQEERAAIQARMESVYHGPDPLNPWFDVKFTRDPSTIPLALFQSGQFATLYFNRTPSFNRPGGEASEVDFGNTNLDGYASIQVNGLVGGNGQPADTSENFVRLSAKIGAHELAHLLGVRHSDSFGPIGMGLHSPPGTEKFGPDYPGPAAAYETFDHIISSPASVGSDRFNDLRDLYFGPREAIKLTFDQKGVTLPESAITHNTIATATPINLYGLTVPNTANSGLNAGKSFQVGAVNVSGNLKIDPSTGRAESDYYALSGNKGDILTMEVDSSLLARLNGQDTIDSVLSVYDAQGNLVPYYGGLARNDDQFEPTDSLILDLVLPATGTYYVQVASFSRNPADPIFDPTNPNSPLNPSNLASTLNPLNPSFSQDRLNSFLATRDGTDIGAYGLFIYRFSSANPTDQGDYLNGRAGNDTLKGGLGKDTLIGGAGQDDIDSGEGGSGYVLGVTPRETSFDLSLINPGLQTTLAISDPSGSEFWDVTVDYGDGSIVHYNNVPAVSPVDISHTYSTPGIYTARISVQNDDGQVGTSSLSVKVSGQKASSFVVAPVGTGTYGATATITASLGSDGIALAGKTVSFTFTNGFVVTALGSATTDSSGVATLTGVDLTRIGAGTYVGYLGANFAGDLLYQATSSSGNLVIAKASLTVTADAKTKVYGSADPALTYIPSGTLFYGDSYSVISGVSLTTNTGALATVGTHPISISGGSAANYNITTVNGLLTVSPKALVVTANSLNKNFGNTLTFSGNEFTATGLVYSDSLTSVTLSSSGSPASAPVGGYAILPSAPVGTGLENYSISYSAGVLTVSTRAGSVYLLNPTSSGSLNLSGNANLNVIGDLVVDSNSSSAITASGNSSAKASVLLNMGGISISGDAKVTTPQGRPGTISDPYANLPVPSSTGSALTVSVSGNSKQTINPGTYSSIKVFGNGVLTLNPGVYIIAGGGLSVSGNGSINGTGVTIYNAGSNAISTGPATFGGIGLNSNGVVQLSAPLTGPYAGILVFQSRDNTLAMSLSGNSPLGISGMIYAPKALLSLSGNAQLQSHIPIVVDKLQISGNGSSSLSTEGTGTTAGQLLSGDRALFIDDQNGYLNGNARARIHDAINQLEQLLQPYSVTVSLTTDRATADLVLSTSTTSPVGGFAQGVLGCYSETGEITLIQGWNWYTGSDPAGIGANQFDFSTIVVHELGHALGLGHSANPASTMFAGLGTGQTRRTLTTADLCVPESEDGEGGYEGLHAIQKEHGTAAPVRNEISATVSKSHSPTSSDGTLVSILDRVFTVSSPFESLTGSISGILTHGSPLTPKFGNGMINRSNKTVGSFGLMSAAPLVGKTSNQLKLRQTLADSVALEMAQTEILGMGAGALATGGSQNEDIGIHERGVPKHV